METILLPNINQFKPFLSIENLESIEKEITSAVDIYNYDGDRFLRLQCGNGIHVDVEVIYSGFSYRRIQLNSLYVMYKVNDEFQSLDEYDEPLSNLVTDSLFELDTKEEEEYELQNQFV